MWRPFYASASCDKKSESLRIRISSVETKDSNGSLPIGSPVVTRFRRVGSLSQGSSGCLSSQTSTWVIQGRPRGRPRLDRSSASTEAGARSGAYLLAPHFSTLARLQSRQIKQLMYIIANK